MTNLKIAIGDPSSLSDVTLKRSNVTYVEKSLTFSHRHSVFFFFIHGSRLHRRATRAGKYDTISKNNYAENVTPPLAIRGMDNYNAFALA